MKIILVFFLLIFSFAINAQNLVINGDFELYDQCPTTFGNLNGYLQFVYNPHPLATTDYFNECDLEIDPCSSFGHVGVPVNSHGYQVAQSGKGYIGLALLDYPNTYREYVVIPLSESLEKDSSYLVSFYVSNPETFGKSTNAIMVSFTEDSIPIDLSSNGILNLNGSIMTISPILDNENWQLLSKKYIANGNEKYLTIGNFLSFEEMLITDGDYSPWMCSDVLQIGNPGSAYLYIDNVSVIGCNSFEFFPNVITPNNDGVNDIFSSLIVGYEIVDAVVLSRWGNVVYNSVDGEVNWDGTSNDRPCDEGVYYYHALLKDINTGELLQKQGFVSLIR